MKRKGKRKATPRKHIPRKEARVWYRYAVILGIVVLGTCTAYALKWYCDDIFITLRYADNFLTGKGLVYNEGEYVEGYTHPLWLALLILCQWLGFDPAASSLNLGLLSYIGVVLLFCLISLKLKRSYALFVPVAAIILAVHRDFLIWATGGLETMFFTFLLSLAFWMYYYTGIADRRKLLSVGLLLTLAILTRPDAAVIFALANICLLISRRSLQSLVWFNLPAVCIMSPYLLWKYSYYGQLLPNTYYLKSGGSSYFSQGFSYLWLYLKPYFSSWLFLLALPVVLFSKRKPKGLTFLFVGVLVYILLFVVRVGGDFMYARFVIPMLPFAMLACEMAILHLWPKRQLLAVAAVAVIVCSIMFVEVPRRNEMLQGTKAEILGSESDAPWFRSYKGIADEHFIRTVVDPIDNERWGGQILESYFRDLDVTVLLRHRCCLGYYAKFKTCIVHYGLTDEYIAHLPLERRGRVGHEKHATQKYLEDRGTDMLFWSDWPFDNKDRVFMGFILKFPHLNWRVGGYFITYDRELIRRIKARFDDQYEDTGNTFEYTDLERVLDSYIETKLPAMEYQELLNDYRKYRNVYFRHNDDKAREGKFLNRLRDLANSGAVN